MKAEDWESALTRAGKFRDANVLYCISFIHGLMKVGTSSSMRNRMRQYDAHGLLKPLFEWVVIVKVCSNNFAAERYAISLFGEHLKKHGREIFESSSITFAKKIIHYCAANARQGTQAETLVTAFARLGGKTCVAKRFGYELTTVNSWACRGKIPEKVFVRDKKLSRAFKRAGYRWESKNAS